MEKRNTIQKELVLNAVTKMHRHVTADEVYDYIRKIIHLSEKEQFIGI